MAIGTEHRVAVDRETRADGGVVWRTDKARYEAKRGDRMIFQTNGVAARIWIPDARIFGKEFLTIDADSGWAAEATIDPDLAIEKEMRIDFSFYLVDDRRMAEGASPPNMVISP